MYQVNATAMFTDPEDTLNTWIQAYEAAATSLYDDNQRKYATTGGLAALLESILTNIAIGEFQNVECALDLLMSGQAKALFRMRNRTSTKCATTSSFKRSSMPYVGRAFLSRCLLTSTTVPGTK